MVEVPMVEVPMVEVPMVEGRAHLTRSPKISVIIPTLNEEANLPLVLPLLPPDLYEVILVDGRSTDNTIAVATALLPDIRVVHQTRKGKGNAMACGFAAATGDILVMLDADGSADPGEIPSYVAALVAGADFAKGSRFTTGGGSDDITGLRRSGNRLLNTLVNVLFGTRYTDLCYGYNAFWRSCLPAIDVHPGLRSSCDALQWGDGFEIETLINVRVARARLNVAEVPSYERERAHGVSNLNTFRDGLRVLKAIAKERVQRTPARASGLTTITTLPPSLRRDLRHA
jgi:Glycosyltransferases involved in cell wall biogenesis